MSKGRRRGRAGRGGMMMRLFVAALLGGALLGGSQGATAATFKHNPVLFVHGIEGSGAQFESQAMRFMSNAYPQAWIDEVDYNSTRAVGDKSQVDQQIDEAIAALKQRTGRSQVDVIAHSLGTSVMYDYLTNGAKAAERRASVGHYINVDGQEKNPGVPTLAVWAGRGTPGRQMEGAQNVTIPNQTHVQTCTSAESFIQYYKFLVGHEPRHDISPRRSIEIAGKALDFPENSGLAGATVEIWPVNGNGARSATTPVASIAITDGSEGGGAWGPVAVKAGQRYEFAVSQPGVGRLHMYYEPFVRSDYTLRLLASPAIEQYSGNRPGSLSGVMIRYKEFWGDQGSENDQLLINALDVCTEALCPAKKQVNAFFAFDGNRDGKTELTEDPALGGLPFIQGADVFVRGSSPTDETVSYQLVSRGGGGVRTLNVPNWEAKVEGDGILIQWRDFERLTF